MSTTGPHNKAHQPPRPRPYPPRPGGRPVDVRRWDIETSLRGTRAEGDQDE